MSETLVEDQVAELLGEGAAGSGPEVELHSLSGFDSLKHVRLILAIEEFRGIPLEPEQIEKLKTIGDLRNLLSLGRSSS